MQNSVAKKIFAVGSAAAMTLAMFVPFAAHAAVHAAGTNVSDSSGTVWMVMPDGTRRAYTSAGAFLSYGFNSWSQVVSASAEDLALPQGSFIPPQDGSIICSDRNDSFAVKGTCYEISNGQKFGFTSAAVFTGLGFSFTNSSLADVSWMTAGSQLLNNTTAAHVPGTLVNNNGTVQLMGVSGLLGIPDVATFNSWGYSFGKVVPANAADKAMTQTGVMATRVAGQLSPTALTNAGCTTNCGNVVSGSVTASLASNTPAAGTLVSNSGNSTGQVGADVAHFTFTGSGTVTQVIVHRIGVSADTSVNNVYLYMGNNRITDAGSLSNGVATFSNSNGIFTVSGSAEVSVRIDVAGKVSGQTIGMQLAGFTVANGTPMVTSISGNLFNTASVTDLAGVTTSGVITTVPGATINAGTVNAVLWTAPISVSQRTVLMKYIAFKQLGSIAQDAIQNLKLFVDGTQVGSTASITSNGANSNVVVFDLTGNPVSLQTGSHTVELHGDVVKGSSYTFDFSLQQATDVVFFDTSYSVNVPFTNGGVQVSQMAPSLTTISSGTLSIGVDPAFTNTQFVTNQSQVILGQWTMKAYGEDVKVQNLSVLLHYTNATGVSTDGFNNLSLFVNGGQVGSSLSALGTAQDVTYPFGSSNLFTITAGTTVTVAVKGDSVLAVGDNIGGVRADLITPTNSLQGVTSFTLSPSSPQTYSGTSLTTGSSSAVFAVNSGYSSQSLSANSLKQKIGSYVIQAGSNDGVRVSSLVVGYAGSTLPMTDLANVYVVTPDMPNGSTPVAPPTVNTGTNNFVTNFTVAANQTATVDVYADILSLPTGTLNNNNGPTLTAATIIVNGSPSTDQLSTLTVGSNVTSGNTFSATYTQTDHSTSTTVSYQASSTDTSIQVASHLAALLTASSAVASTTVTTNAATVILTGKASTTVFTLTNVTATTGTQGAGSTASVITSMQGQGTGTTSNQVVYLNNLGTSVGVAQTGQTITIGNGSLASIAVSGASPSSAFVIGGTVTQPAATFTLVAGTQGGANVTELGFNVSGTQIGGGSLTNGITLVNVGGSSGQVINGRALVSGLNIVVPVGNAGIDVPVTVSYATVGSNGVADQSVKLTLTHIKFISGNKTTGMSPSSGSGLGLLWSGDTTTNTVLGANGYDSNTMYLVSTYPTVTLASSGNVFSTADNATGLLVAKITVQANAAGAVAITALPLSFSLSSGSQTDGAFAARLVDDSNNSVVSTSTIATSSSPSITFNNITSGNFTGTKVYDVYVPIYSVVTSSGQTATFSTSLGASSAFLFTDVNGNNGTGGSATNVAAGNGTVTFMPNYPTTQAVINSSGTAK